jgi:SOS-response transcriptional repressor LexA
MRDDIERAPAQQKLLAAILDICQSGEQVPNYQDLADRLGISKSRIPETITKLEDKGYIRCQETAKGRVRTGSITPTGKAWEWRSQSWAGDSPPAAATVLELARTQGMPVVTRAGAGNAQNADDGGDPEYVDLPADRVSRPDVFVAEVRGDSMAGDDLRTGDHVIVDPHARWNDGDMVVVADEGALVVKRLWHDGDSILLESSNPEHAPIVLKRGREHLGGQSVRGKVIGVVLWHVKPGRRNQRTQSAAARDRHR